MNEKTRHNVIRRFTSKHILFFLFTGLFFVCAVLAAVTENLFFLVVPFLALLVHFGWNEPTGVLWGLIFFLPLSIEFAVSDQLTLDLPDEPLMIFLAIYVLAYGCYQPRGLITVLGHRLISLLLISFGWTILAMFTSTENILSLKYLAAKGWYILAFVFAPLILMQSEALIRQAARFFLAGLLIAVLLVLFRQVLLGFDFSSVNDAVSPLFRNHVNYSAMLVCALPVGYAAYYLSRGKRKYFMLALVLLLLAALYFGYSRGAWLSLGAGLAGYWLLKKRLLFAFYVLGLLIVFSAMTWALSKENYLKFAPEHDKTIFHPVFGQHLRATYQLKDISTAERLYRWVAGIRMVGEKPLTGFGPNAFYYHYKEYALPSFKTWVSDNPERSTVHNYFLLLAVEQGIPAMLIFLLLIGASLFYAQVLYHRIKEHFYRIVVATAGVILVMITILNMLSDLVETDKIGSLFFLCIAMLVNSDMRTRSKVEV